MAPPDPLSLEDVRHVARLARLALDETQLEQYRRELSTVLEHLGRLAELDLEGVEPMAHPLDLHNRLDDDVVGEALPVQAILDLAPAVQESYISVPKVLD